MNRANDALQAEYAFVGGLMLYPEESIAIDDFGLTAEHFSHPLMRHAFGSICALLEESKTVDLVAVYDDMRTRNLAPDLSELNAAQQTVSSARSVRAAAEVLVKERSRQTTIDALSDALQFATTSPDPDAALDAAQSMLSKLQQAVGRKEPKLASELADDRLDYYDRLLRGDHVSDAMPTHIPALDKALNGGLQTGRLYILAARPGVGKSSFGQWLALQLAKAHKPALFLSLEMPAYEVIDRAVSYLGKASYEVIQTGVGANDDDWTGLVAGIDRLKGLPYYVDDQPGLTISHIRAKAHAVKRRGLRLLVLDYLQLCAGIGDNRNAEIEGITKGLKGMAKELDIAVMVLSQLNREVEKRAGGRPQLSDLRDSGSIEQDADVVMFLWNLKNKIEVGAAIEKNRQGKRTDFILNFDGDYQRWAQSTINLSDLLTKEPPKSRRGME